MSTSRIIAAAVIASAALATGASGALPKPETTEIDPKIPALGGLELGMSRDRVKDEWGAGLECFPDPGHVDCEYTDAGLGGSAGVSFRRGGLVKVDINAGHRDSGAFDFDGPLSALETTRGIHIGSPFARVRAAYPKARILNETSSLSVTIIVAGPRNSYTFFALTNKGDRYDKRRVAQIGIASRSFCAPQAADFCRRSQR